MPNAWTTWVKEWAKKNNTSYGCALSDIDCSAEYRLQKEDKANAQQRKKAQPRMKPPSLTQAMDQAMPSTEPINKNIMIKPRPVMQPAKAKRGRPVVHTTKEAKYAAKLHSNKMKRRERAAGGGDNFPILNLV